MKRKKGKKWGKKREREKSSTGSANDSKRKECGNKTGASTANLPGFSNEWRKHVNGQCVKASTWKCAVCLSS